MLYRTGSNLYWLKNSYQINTSYLGIGIQNPQVQLDVSGDMQISNTLFVGSDITTTGNFIINDKKPTLTLCSPTEFT
jgi:hypothetical protein